MRLNKTTGLGLMLLALALASCQAGWPMGGLRMGMDAVDEAGIGIPSDAGRLTIKLDASALAKLAAGGRALQALVSDIQYVTIVVQPQGFAEQSQVIQRTQLAGGTGSVVFNNLPAVPTTVRISAFDAGSKLIGSGTQSVSVAAGTPTTVAFAIPLDPTYIQPVGSINGTVSFQDGPQIVGTPPPGAVTPSGTVLQTLTVGYGPQAVAFDPAGNAWVLAYASDQIYRFDPSGQKIDTIKIVPGPTSNVARPAAIAFDRLGNAWVANYQAGTVTSYDPTGKPLATIPVGLYPTALSFDAMGNLWVVCYFGNNVVILSPSTGKPVGGFKVGTNPIALAFDGLGNGLVLGLKSQDVNKVQPPLGRVLQTYKVGASPQALVFDLLGDLWVSNGSSNNLMKFDPQGNLVGTYATGRKPCGLAVDQAGYIWVACTQDNTVMKFSAATGTKLGTYRTGGNGPRNLVVDRGGTIWVTNYDSNNVAKLAP